MSGVAKFGMAILVLLTLALSIPLASAIIGPMRYRSENNSEGWNASQLTADFLTVSYNATISDSLITTSLWAGTVYENSQPLSDRYVPYTGAVKNVDLGSNNLDTTGTISGWKWQGEDCIATGIPGATALGINTKANGTYGATALGDHTIASGPYGATALGGFTIASGPHGATALGYETIASGQYGALASGYKTEASGIYGATALGWEAKAIGDASFATGVGTIASGEVSTAMGAETTASGEASFATGAGTTASGEASTAMGSVTTAESYSSVAVGRHNVGGGSTTTWVATDPLFEIGIGTSDYIRANALTVLKNGNVGIGTTDPQEALDLADGNLTTTGTGTFGELVVDTDIIITSGGKVGFGRSPLAYPAIHWDFMMDGTKAYGMSIDGSTNEFTGRGMFTPLKVTATAAEDPSSMPISMSGLYEVLKNHHKGTGDLLEEEEDFISANKALDFSLTIDGDHDFDGGNEYGLSEMNRIVTGVFNRKGTITTTNCVDNKIRNHGMYFSVRDSTSLNSAGETLTVENKGAEFRVSESGNEIAGTLTKTNTGLIVYVSGGGTTNKALEITSSSGADTNWAIYDSSGADNYFAGNVGIGVAPPTEALDVAGNAAISGNLTAENVWLPTYIFAHTSNTIPVAVAGVWYNITFNETGYIKQGITHTHNDATNDTFRIVDTGIYELQWDLSYEDSAASPNSNVVTRIVRNGEEINGSLRENDLDKKDSDVLTHGFAIALLTAGDKIKVQFTSDDITVSLITDFTYGEHADSAAFSIKRIG